MIDPARAFHAEDARPGAVKMRSPIAKLTAREREVLQWIAQGKRNREIGAIMNISPRTIQKHVQSILVKLCVETRGAAAATWFEQMIASRTE
jgi:DNA-binding CsgD family transcriptional regulator